MSQLSLSGIEQSLLSIPNELEVSDLALAQLRFALGDAEDTLEVAKTNAALKAPEASNEQRRKLNRESAIANDQACWERAQQVRDTKNHIAELEADNARLRRQFAAACHLAELAASNNYLMAKGGKHE